MSRFRGVRLGGEVLLCFVRVDDRYERRNKKLMSARV